jgi:hypothetical protein
MSHVAEMKAEINDLDALEAACKSLGLELVREQKTYRWWGHSVGDYPLPQGFKESDLGKCEHAIRIPHNHEAYEIGVCQRRDGQPGYTLLWDFYNGGYGMEQKVGQDGIKLQDEYAVQTAIMQLTSEGYQVEVERTQEGRAVVTARQW